MFRKIILIAGPTASGKSKIAISIAQKVKGEIINADSMQVYKEFSILTSRPDKKDLKKIKHHLYGFVPVKNHFSTGHWLRKVKNKIINLNSKKKTPIIVGGTGLYFNCILKGLSKIPSISAKKRLKIRLYHNKIGQKKFYNLLIKKDPLCKGKFDKTDIQRTLRAYEVKHYTKTSLYEWFKNTKSDFKDYNIKKIFINTPKSQLLKNIGSRVDQMIKKGCFDEVRNFQRLKINKALSANKIIGILEISDYLNKKTDINQLKEKILIKTRQYAKRQKTWSRGHMSDWNMIYHKNTSVLIKKVLKLVS